MRIAFLNRIAWPDEGATALYLTDVAEALADAGHEVHVVCGAAGYRALGPATRRPPGTRRGVRYHRVPGARGRGVLGRAGASALFLARAAWRLLRVPRPDVVIGLTDPPFADVVAGVVGRLRGARAVHWLMDVYPDVAVAAGVLRARGAAASALGRVMSCALRRAGAVVVLGGAMRRPVLSRGVARGRIRVVENWAPSVVEEAAASPAPPRDPAGPWTLLYSGTYGVAHDLEPLLRRLRLLPAGTRVRLVVQASGARLADLRRAAADLPVPVEWRAPVPLAALPGALREGDVHVVSVRAGFERLVVPSKAYAPLALGRPLLLVGAARTSLRARAAPVAAGPSWLTGADLLWYEAPPRPRAEGLRAWRALVESLGPAADPAARARR